MLAKDGSPLIAARYLRKSRAEELTPDEEVLSRHRQALDELASRLGVTVKSSYEEVVSGESLYSRPQMLRLLEAVENGEYDAVLCMDIDRLGRGGMRDQGVILDAFKYSDTLIITPDKVYDLNDDTDEELTEFKSFMARREYKIITKRLRRGLMRTVQEGGYIANAPYGYTKVVKNKIPTLDINEDEAHFVRYIFSRYLEGVGATTIATELNAMGSKPNRMPQWSPSTVRYILRNPTFTGKVVWNRCANIKKGTHGSAKNKRRLQPEDRWIVAQGIHPAIIDEKTFNRAQEIRRERYIPSRFNGEIRNPLAGIVKCSNCGSTMQVQPSMKGGSYLMCKQPGCCAGAKTVYVEAAILNALSDYLKQLTADIPVANRTEERDDASHTLDALERELAKNKVKQTRLFEFLEDGTYDKNTFATRRSILRSQEAELLTKTEACKRRMRLLDASDRRREADEIRNVLSLYSTSAPKEKNRLLKSVLKKVIYIKKKKSKPRDFSVKLYPRTPLS